MPVVFPLWDTDTATTTANAGVHERDGDGTLGKLPSTQDNHTLRGLTQLPTVGLIGLSADVEGWLS